MSSLKEGGKRSNGEVRVRLGKLRCRVREGTFADERSVVINAGDAVYTTFADLKDVHTDVPPTAGTEVDGFLAVRVLPQRSGEKVLVALPRDTFSSGSRIYVDKGLVV